MNTSSWRPFRSKQRYWLKKSRYGQKQSARQSIVFSLKGSTGDSECLLAKKRSQREKDISFLRWFCTCIYPVYPVISIWQFVGSYLPACFVRTLFLSWKPRRSLLMCWWLINHPSSFTPLTAFSHRHILTGVVDLKKKFLICSRLEPSSPWTTYNTAWFT